MIIIQKVRVFLIIMIAYKQKLTAGGFQQLVTQEFLIINLMMGMRDLLAVCRLGPGEVVGLHF